MTFVTLAVLEWMAVISKIHFFPKFCRRCSWSGASALTPCFINPLLIRVMHCASFKVSFLFPPMVCLFYTTVFLNFQFGFINYEVGDSKKLFFHVKEVQDGIELQAGDEVEFSVILNQRTGKCSACNVWRVWWVCCSLVTSFDCLLTFVISALSCFFTFHHCFV